MGRMEINEIDEGKISDLEYGGDQTEKGRVFAPEYGSKKTYRSSFSEKSSDKMYRSSISDKSSDKTYSSSLNDKGTKSSISTTIGTESSCEFADKIAEKKMNMVKKIRDLAALTIEENPKE